ncbi:MAG: hypothetical protein K0S00_4070 [Xanthobacteraceae bacterium]|jgi:predicted RecA/RadA family phage recombinase|nr:hypothetical protein [Xanthobacteraceae bacterium]
MNNFVKHGDIVTMKAPYNVASGGGAQVGQLFGVTVATVAYQDDGEFKTTGIFDLTKIGSQAWAVGDLVYWDNTNKRCTTVATGNLLIGAAMAAVTNAAGNTVGQVRLNGVARPNEA